MFSKVNSNLLLNSSLVLLFIVDHLLSKPLVEDFKSLPSPEQLKYKVIIRVIIIFLNILIIISKKI